MNKKIYLKEILLIVIICVVSLGTCFGIHKVFHKKTTKELINISTLSDKFIDKYLEEVSSVTEEEKENMLIVISSTDIKNTYGATNVIEAPNNQYILEYKNEKEKEYALNELKNDKSLASVEENGTYTVEETSYNSWGISKMSLDTAISTANNYNSIMNDVTVAVIDTGCDMTLMNKYYSGKVVEVYDELEKSTASITDTYGHGTHVAGTIAEGTPENVKVLPIKVTTGKNMYYTDIIAAINYVTSYKKADVINLSLGGYSSSSSLEQAIESAKEKNIITVAAAGNDSSSKTHYPSGYSNTISIASVDSSLNRSTFSNYGTTITFAAPGTNIKSIMSSTNTISIEDGNTDGDDDHETISGTSMATPHAAAAVALLKGYNKDLTLDNVIEILKDKAIDLGTTGWDKYYGYGLISFKDASFCDGTYCDEYNVFMDESKKIDSIGLTNISFTKYNYNTITNILGSEVTITFSDSKTETVLLKDLPNVKISDYDPNVTGSQTITIKYGTHTITTTVTNPENYENGWEYNTLSDGTVEITGYKDHGLDIDKLYIPEKIDSKTVVAFADNFKFSETGNDIKNYTYLYLPSTFKRIGNYSLSNTNIKYVYGTEIEAGQHSFDNSKIEEVYANLTKIEDYAFNECTDLTTLKSSDITSIYQIEDIGNYAFYNCTSLYIVNLDIMSNIGEYAFYNTTALKLISLIDTETVGKYAFYNSGLTSVYFGTNLDTVYESAFENCKNLTSVDFTYGKIQSKAFYNSGTEKLGVYKVDYIAEDAFAYSPIKTNNGQVTDSDATYISDSSVGIYEQATKKLIVGFYSSDGDSIVNTLTSIKEIGNYAFTGNSKLKKIVIPTTVTKIGDHSFEDCANLTYVYMLGENTTFSSKSFNSENLIMYVHKDSNVKKLAKENNIEYRHFEPDSYELVNLKSTYTALDNFTGDNALKAKLTYNEETTRTEIVSDERKLSPIESSYVRTLATTYQTNSTNFVYGDTYFYVTIRTGLGILVCSNEKVSINVTKATPSYTLPNDLTANIYQKLSDIELPSGFTWMNENIELTESGIRTYKVKYTPTDTTNYEIVENIDVSVTVVDNRELIEPDIKVSDRKYDGTTNVPIKNITISNLSEGEYTIVSATSSSKNIGKRTATIKIKLSDSKFKTNYFEGKVQEKEFTVDFNILKVTEGVQSITYQTHVQNVGWQEIKKDGEMSGTSGQSLRLEGIKIKLNSQDYEGDIEYRTHIQNIGWETTWKKNGEMSGTSGKALRLEAIEIKLTDDMAEYYDVYYRVHAQNFGWLGWAKNGEDAGTAGYSYRLEAIEIKLVEKDKSFAEYGKETPYYQNKITYQTHVQNIGWQENVNEGEVSGTIGQSKRLEGIIINKNSVNYDGNIIYRTHIQNIGWESSWKNNGIMSGTSGQGLRLEAIEIKLTDELKEHYDIYYRVHAEEFGWLGWAKNGESAGTAGYGYRLEAIEIKLVEKDTEFEEYGNSLAFQQKQLQYQTHVQNIGWMSNVTDEEISGTSGQSLRIEALKIKLNSQLYDGNILYKSYIEGKGWESTWKQNGEMSGTSGESKKIEAIQVKLDGTMAEKYDIYYRVHVENIGWMAWAKNGESAGTNGYIYRIEAIELTLVEKGKTPPVRTNQNATGSFIKK